ncbi:ABC transporter substrate-binding protein [Brassicibacter mesophilus]|uniref:ABC transporter substrate-binding protein n=1 Tax=Brassicibacter mesophilus TaxID=745119 RepID=UPI003D1BFEBE
MIKLYNVFKRERNRTFKKFIKMSSFFKILCTVTIIAFIINIIPALAFAQDNDKVVLQLRWHHQYQFAGYYAAKWMGYYEQEGLDVEIRPALTENIGVLYATEEVAEGRAQFGIGSSDILLSQDRGAELCVVASVFQRSPIEYYMREDASYRSIVDLTKLKVARRQNDLLDIELQAMLISEGINPNKLPLIIDTEEFTVNDFKTHKYDVIPGYMGAIIDFYAQKEGINLKVIKPIDYGIDFYGDSLFTSKKLAYEDPELVEKFRKASMKGWEYAHDHPEEVAERIANEYKVKGIPHKDFIEYNKYQASKISQLTLYPIVEMGNVNPYRWQKMHEMLTKLNLVKGQINLEDFVFDYQKITTEKYKKIEKGIILFLIISFIASIIIFMFHLANKNSMLKNEVSERKRAENRIIKSKQRYEAIFSSAILGITITSKEGIILQANEKWLSMTGYSEKEILGKDIREFIDDDSDKNIIKKIGDFNSGKINNYEIERKYKRRDGSIFWGKLFMTSIYDQDSERKVNLGMVVDITNRKIEEETVKRSEKRFRNIIKEVASQISDNENAGSFLIKDNDFNDAYNSDNERSRLSLKLEKINLELERMFKKELDENKRKEALLIYQARLAAMGEMIANIAHQWRQPLNSLGLILSNIEDAYIYNELDNEYLHSSVEKSRRLILKMSETIDDFRYFSSPNNKKEKFSIYDNIKILLELVEENLRFNDIKVKFEDIKNIEAYGYANQYSQAIFNIINNSIDALSVSSTEDKEIRISIHEEKDMAIVEISDNGGGISSDIADKIFDVYFTTKQGSKGTGLGLYITKIIIENNMDGKIQWENTLDGICMKVAIPKDKE